MYVLEDTNPWLGYPVLRTNEHSLARLFATSRTTLRTKATGNKFVAMYNVAYARVGDYHSKGFHEVIAVE